MLKPLWTARAALFGIVGLMAFATGCQDSLKSDLARYQQENQELRAERETIQHALEAAEADRARLSEKLTQVEQEVQENPFAEIDNVQVIPGQGQITVRLPGDILFDAGKVTLKDSATKTLTEVADVLKREYGEKNIRVEGYTDTDPIRKSSWKDNLELSAQRAMTVERFLASRGVPDQRVYSAGFGEARPQKTKAESRRVEIVVVMR